MTDFKTNHHHWLRSSDEERLALVFGVCADGITRTGQAPTVWTIANAVGIKSYAGTVKYVNVLISTGYLKRVSQGVIKFGDDCYLKTNGIPFHIAPVKRKTPLE